jgi:hypothetical protein
LTGANRAKRGRRESTTRGGTPRRRRRMTRDVVKSGHLRRGWARKIQLVIYSRPGAETRNTRAFFLCGRENLKKKAKGRGRFKRVVFRHLSVFYWLLKSSQDTFVPRSSCSGWSRWTVQRESRTDC